MRSTRVRRLRLHVLGERCLSWRDTVRGMCWRGRRAWKDSWTRRGWGSYGGWVRPQRRAHVLAPQSGFVRKKGFISPRVCLEVFVMHPRCGTSSELTEEILMTGEHVVQAF